MNIAIVHYRAGRTDGVSLEIEKRRKILEGLGHKVSIISGPVSEGSDFVISELEFDRHDVNEIKENSFSYFNQNALSPHDLMQKIRDLAYRIELEFTRCGREEGFEAVILHNILSHGRHIAAASAFTHLAETMVIPLIAVHHDFYWEREVYSKASCPEICSYLNKYVPPDLENITHVCINSQAQLELKKRRGISSALLPDIFDFSMPEWKTDDFNRDFMKAADINANDMVVLQATRIVERKGIEMAVQLVRKLTDMKKLLEGKTLYNGKKILPESRVVLLLAGYTEEVSMDYEKKLRDMMNREGIEYRFISNIVGAERVFTPEKIYSLWDTYVYADLVTFPSLEEGWGNQFIEAVFAKRPIVVFEYPVFKSDLKPEGYSYLSLGDSISGIDEDGLNFLSDEIIENAAYETISLLLSDATRQLLNKNFLIGKMHHDVDRAELFFTNALC